MDALDKDLAPWRALGAHHVSPSRLASLRAQVLDQVAGADPLEEPAGGEVLVAGDWHGDSGWAGHVVRRTGGAGVPLVLQLGDFGFWHGPEGEAYLDAVELACRQAGVAVCWLDGNHEDFHLLTRFPVAPCGLRPVRPHWPADVVLCHDRPAMAANAQGQRPGSWHAAAPPAWDRADLAAADAHSALLQRVVDAAQPTRLFHGHLHRRDDTLVDPAPWGRSCQVTSLGDQSSGHDGNTALTAL